MLIRLYETSVFVEITTQATELGNASIVFINLSLRNLTMPISTNLSKSGISSICENSRSDLLNLLLIKGLLRNGFGDLLVHLLKLLSHVIGGLFTNLHLGVIDLSFKPKVESIEGVSKVLRDQTGILEIVSKLLTTKEFRTITGFRLGLLSLSIDITDHCEPVGLLDRIGDREGRGLTKTNTLLITNRTRRGLHR